MQVIQPWEIWEYIKLPKIPDGVLSIEDLSEHENRLLNTGLQVLRLVQKENGQRRSINGLNRVAQNRYPELPWKDVSISQIAEAWKIAGLPSLIDAIRDARKLPVNCGRIATIRAKLSESVAVEMRTPDVTEAFVSIDAHLKTGEAVQPAMRLYRVMAKANYGNYLFHVLGFCPPSMLAVTQLCIFHNFLHSPVKTGRAVD